MQRSRVASSFWLSSILKAGHQLCSHLRKQMSRTDPAILMRIMRETLNHPFWKHDSEYEWRPDLGNCYAFCSCAAFGNGCPGKPVKLEDPAWWHLNWSCRWQDWKEFRSEYWDSQGQAFSSAKSQSNISYICKSSDKMHIYVWPPCLSTIYINNVHSLHLRRDSSFHDKFQSLLNHAKTLNSKKIQASQCSGEYNCRVHVWVPFPRKSTLLFHLLFPRSKARAQKWWCPHLAERTEVAKDVSHDLSVILSDDSNLFTPNSKHENIVVMAADIHKKISSNTLFPD